MKAVIISALCVAFFSHHVYNMAFVRFDYGHNMKVMMEMMTKMTTMMMMIKNMIATKMMVIKMMIATMMTTMTWMVMTI